MFSDQYISWAKGNPGAMQFLATMVHPSNAMISSPILQKIQSIGSLRGTNLYVLWSDIGNRDLKKVAEICRLVPDNVLADACSRQDYSGRDVVAPYLNKEAKELGIIQPAQLTAVNVNNTFLDCMFDESESTDNRVEAHGVMLHVGFHPERLAKNKNLIEQMLSELPDSFQKRGGGGWSFLNMCNDKSDNQWADDHSTMDKLVCLGLATGKLSYLMERDHWVTLPGQMPYLIVD